MIIPEIDSQILDFLPIEEVIENRRVSGSWYSYVRSKSRLDLPNFISLLQDKDRREFMIGWDEVKTIYGAINFCTEQDYKSYLTLEWKFEMVDYLDECRCYLLPRITNPKYVGKSCTIIGELDRDFQEVDWDEDNITLENTEWDSFEVKVDGEIIYSWFR